MSSTLNAWLPSAVLGCYVVDALGDLRAHPTADMGSIGLTNEIVIQSVAGGNRDDKKYLEMVVRGVCDNVSWILRTAADRAGGFIASCRNPVKASYVKKHAVLGGISMAINLGHKILSSTSVSNKIKIIEEETKGEIIFIGKVYKHQLQYTKDAFDAGKITIKSDNKEANLHIVNEYMALEIDGEIKGSYPDVITTLDKDGEAISAGHIKEGDEIYILHVHKNKIPLSSTIKDRSIYIKIEEILNLNITRYALGD